MGAKQKKTIRTIKNIEALRPAEKEGGRRLVPDHEVKGLFVRVTDSGFRSFVVIRRMPKEHGGRLVNFALGDVDVLGLADARQQAGDIVKNIKRGIAPARTANQPTPAPEAAGERTFRAVADLFNKRHLSKLRRGDRVWGSIEMHVMPKWESRPIESITRADVLELLDRLEDQGKPYARNRMLATVRKLFNWARWDRGLISTNPAERIEMLPEAKRDRVLTDRELRIVWKAAGRLRVEFRALIRLMLLMAARENEIASGVAGEIGEAMRIEVGGADSDDAGDAWVVPWIIPGSRMKNGLPHAVPLCDTALQEVEAASSEGRYILSTHPEGATSISGFSYLKRALDAKIVEVMQEEAVEKGEDPESVKPLDDWRFHDLRRTARTNMSKLRIDSEIAERCIAHLPVGVRAHYDHHDFLIEKAEAFARWETKLLSIVNPKPAAANVVQFPVAANA